MATDQDIARLRARIARLEQLVGNPGGSTGATGSVTTHTHTLGGASDVTITSVADNEVLAYDSGGTWINQTAAEAGLATSAHTHTLDDGSDVVITSVADNEVLAYDSGGNWINQTAAEAGLATSSHTHALDDGSDVVITTPADNEVLAYDSGGNWINQTPAEAGLAAVGSAQTFSALQTFSSGLTFGDETLSNYDEGTWTPEITGSSSNPTVTYSTQSGIYVRIGRLVFYSFSVGISTYSGGSGDLLISLPFTPVSPRCVAATNFIGVDLSASAVDVMFMPSIAAATGELIECFDNAAQNKLSVSAVSASSNIRATGTFFVS